MIYYDIQDNLDRFSKLRAFFPLSLYDHKKNSMF
jgi:hypothetical protein